ncbi:MarR family transcriptional regulator [[Mycobacterium] kokjensenii]|uniref:MarR family transcriptional regulator n=1 Tax=[Mycobacterium] kokjensenii TaxID=3064287 RepID=A0ABN9MXM4_9MYCO|nr:MarR family transcriptional regulator [Mycolicibacter sp. MU0083]CAJ1495363.1 MarR family transcriptional regulator [Mycolicibacter sp. MU0083]
MSDRIDRVAADLAREIGPLRRAMSRATRGAEGLPDLPENQIEVLRAAASAPGITTGAVAALLQLARPTVSNLLNAMRRDGLVELRRRTDDARITEVHLTARARRLLARYDSAASTLVYAALSELDDTQRRSIAAAIPALARLREILGSG